MLKGAWTETALPRSKRRHWEAPWPWQQPPTQLPHPRPPHPPLLPRRRRQTESKERGPLLLPPEPEREPACCFGFFILNPNNHNHLNLIFLKSPVLCVESQLEEGRMESSGKARVGRLDDLRHSPSLLQHYNRPALTYSAFLITGIVATEKSRAQEWRRATKKHAQKECLLL